MRCASLSGNLRAVQLILAMVCFVSGTAGFERVWAQQSSPSRPATTPAASTPAGTPAMGTPRGTPANPTPSTEAARRSACEHTVAVLAGREKDAKALASPDVQSLAGEVPDLAVCGAVASDSDALCKLTGGGDANTSCRVTWSTFHELRTNPKGRGFIYPEAQYEKCKTDMPAGICEKFRAAAVSGDPKKCEGDWSAGVPKDKHLPGTEGKRPEEMFELLASFCKALISLDKSQCRTLKDPNFVRECERQMGPSEIFAKGLKGLAESGPQPERDLAKAALGQADACKAQSQTAMDKCMARPAPAAGGTPPPTSAPGAPGGTPAAPRAPGSTPVSG